MEVQVVGCLVTDRKGSRKVRWAAWKQDLSFLLCKHHTHGYECWEKEKLNPQNICDQLGYKLKLGKRLNFKRSWFGFKFADLSVNLISLSLGIHDLKPTSSRKKKAPNLSSNNQKVPCDIRITASNLVHNSINAVRSGLLRHKTQPVQALLSDWAS